MNDEVYEMSYYDILNMPEEMQRIYMPQFEKLLEEVDDSVYSPRRTLIGMLSETEDLKRNCISTYLFSGEKLLYYPNIIYRRVAKPFTCPLSGERVVKGMDGLVWDPLFVLPETREVYALQKKLRLYYYYEYFLPKSVIDLDDFWFKYDNAYDLSFEEFYNLSCNLGANGLSLRKIKNGKSVLHKN